MAPVQALTAVEADIDVLIFNAGIYQTKRDVTAEGFEKVFAVHYLSYFMMTLGLEARLKAQARARILVVNSEGHRFAVWGLDMEDLNWERRRYGGLRSYGSAKLAQLLAMRVFAERFRDSGVTINALHPGAVKTETGKENGRIYRWYKRNVLDRVLKDASVSSEALYTLGVSEKYEGVSGQFFNLTTVEAPSPPALDMEVAEALWETSLEICGLNEGAEERERAS